MGIKGFSAWLRTAFPQVFCPIPTIPGTAKQQAMHFDQVYVDLNPFLHVAARQSDGIDELIKTCRRNLRTVLQNLTRPNSMVYVSMDGPAPLAKLPEQRARRQDSAMAAARRNTFDAQQITPGCIAMTTIESQVYTLLRELFFASGKTTAAQSNDFSAILDGSGVEGEGEFKIIRKLVHDHIKGDAFKGRVTRAILACDADLFLQALLSDVPHLYLFDPFAPYTSQTPIFSVDRWRRALAAESSESLSEDSNKGRRMAFDFVAFALMSGSDYAPALKYANYKSLWPNYLDFIKNPINATKKPRYTMNNNSSNFVDADNKTFNLVVLKEFFNFYLSERLPENLMEPLKAFHEELDPTGKKERILNYMEHLIWNLEALVSCNVPDLSISMLVEKTAPSLIELADFDAEELQNILNKRLMKPPKPTETESCKNENEPKVSLFKYPGVMALMALDRNSDCQEFFAEPLRPLMKELKESKLDLSNKSDPELVLELTRRIDAMPKESFSLIERLATFPRLPITLDKTVAQSADAANFYTMALKSSENRDKKIVEEMELPWMRPYVYSVGEEESWRCPLHRMLFGKYRS